MSVASRIKELRESNGLSRNELAEMLGVTVGAISNYENGVSSPKEPILFKIIETMGCDANYLFQDVVNIPKQKNDVTLAEYELIKKYRDLDDLGKEHINTMLGWETERVQAHIKSATQLVDLQQQLTITATDKLYLYTYLRKIACAGTGFYFDDIPTTTIEAPYMPGADFVIGVSGNSMEPDYHDGERLYIQKTDSLSIGDVGIFTVWGECFIKELGERGLISKNPAYDDIPGTEDVRLIGRVLGKVEEV